MAGREGCLKGGGEHMVPDACSRVDKESLRSNPVCPPVCMGQGKVFVIFGYQS